MLKKVYLIIAMQVLLLSSSVVAAEAMDMNKRAFMAVKVKADRGDANSHCALGGMD